MAPFGSARKTGMAAATAASRRGAAGMQAKRARAAGVSGVDENAPPPARRPGRRACAQDGARRLGRVLSRRRCRHRRRCGRGSAVTSPAPMMAALARSAATRSPLGDVAAAVVASAVRTVAQAPPPAGGAAGADARRRCRHEFGPDERGGVGAQRACALFCGVPRDGEVARRVQAAREEFEVIEVSSQ